MASRSLSCAINDCAMTISPTRSTRLSSFRVSTLTEAPPSLGLAGPDSFSFPGAAGVVPRAGGGARDGDGTGAGVAGATAAAGTGAEAEAAAAAAALGAAGAIAGLEGG